MLHIPQSSLKILKESLQNFKGIGGKTVPMMNTEKKKDICQAENDKIEHFLAIVGG